MRRAIEVNDTRPGELRQIVSKVSQFRLGQRVVFIPAVAHRVSLALSLSIRYNIWRARTTVFYFPFVDFFDGGGFICTSTFPVFPPTLGLLSPDDCRLTLGEDVGDDNIR